MHTSDKWLFSRAKAYLHFHGTQSAPLFHD